MVFGGNGNKAVEGHIKYLCGVCSKDVSRNSILCTACGKWINKQFSGVTGSLGKVQGFECSVGLA